MTKESLIALLRSKAWEEHVPGGATELLISLDDAIAAVRQHSTQGSPETLSALTSAYEALRAIRNADVKWQTSQMDGFLDSISGTLAASGSPVQPTPDPSLIDTAGLDAAISEAFGMKVSQVEIYQLLEAYEAARERGTPEPSLLERSRQVSLHGPSEARRAIEHMYNASKKVDELTKRLKELRRKRATQEGKS